MRGKADEGMPELALRFDLTVPLARYVAEHERDLSFPFRRYQMQRVYRGERAQRGRFREFYQCDIDVIGKDSLSVRYDAEMPAVIYSVFRELDIGAFTIQLNNRKLMRGYFEKPGHRPMASSRCWCCARWTSWTSAAPTTCATRSPARRSACPPTWRGRSSISCRCARPRCRMRSTSSMRWARARRPWSWAAPS